MLFLEYDWSFDVFRFRFGDSFIAFGRWAERSFPSLKEAKLAARECGLAIGRKTDSRTWRVIAA